MISSHTDSAFFVKRRLVYTFVTLRPIALIFYLFRDYVVLPTDPLVYGCQLCPC